MSKYRLLGLICWKKGFSCSFYLWHSPVLHIFPLHTCSWTSKSRFLRLDLKLQQKLLLTWVIIYKSFVQNSTELMLKIKQLKQRLFLSARQGTLATLHAYRYTHQCPKGHLWSCCEGWSAVACDIKAFNKVLIFWACWVHLCQIDITLFHTW